MTPRIPVRLRQEPLVEALWELRFSSPDQATAEILPGLLYQALASRYEKRERLPAAEIPRAIADTDPNLRYQPTVRFLDPPFSVLIGARSVGVSCAKPYAGWVRFRERILEVAAALQKTGLVTTPERFSLKYIDLLDLEAKPTLALLSAKLQVAGRSLETEPLHLRTEFREGTCVHIVQIA